MHTDLFANGKIGDPFYRLNEKDQQWIDHESWEYRTTLRADAALLAHERVELVFAGLDTFAEVFVNGAVGAVRRQHVPQLARRREAAAAAPATTCSSCASARRSSRCRARIDHLGYRLPAANDQGKEMVSMWARKAPYHYGWDWGPRFVTSGIWRPVALETWDERAHRRRADVPEPARRRRRRR